MNEELGILAIKLWDIYATEPVCLGIGFSFLLFLAVLICIALT